MNHLRDRLVETALEWERAFGNAPGVTSAISELDAALLIGLTVEQYSAAMQGSTAVQKGFDFKFNDSRYQVKACRPSGKKGSFVTKVPKASNYDWDFLIWLLYDKSYAVQEAWLWSMESYRREFDGLKRLSPLHMRRGCSLKGATTDGS